MSPLADHLVRLAVLAAAPIAALATPSFAQFSVAGPIAGPKVMPESSTHADVDGDGDLDVVFTSIDFAGITDRDAVLWSENLDGLGLAFQHHFVGGGFGNPRGVDAPDLDGDGHVDILFAETGAHAIRWYPGDGAGGFGPLQTVATGLDLPRGVFTADVDSDGDVDVFWHSTGGTVAWHENLGAGAFSAQTVVSTAAVDSYGLELEDLDGDGDLDLFVPRGGDTDPAWFENTDGLGAFSGPNVVSVGGWLAADAGDVDADGDVDLVGGKPYGPLAWVRNGGAGAFSGAEIIAAEGQTHAVLAVDVELDGDLDVFATDQFGSGTQLFRKSTTPDEFQPEALVNSGWNPSGLHAPDLDGDGDGDLVTCTLGRIVINANDGSGPSGFGATQPLATGTHSPRDVLAADLDGDGDRDVVTSYGDALALGWSENLDGLGTFASPHYLFNSLFGTFMPHHVRGTAAEDLDGDGDRDLVWLETAPGSIPGFGGLAWSPNDGSGGFDTRIAAAPAHTEYADGAAADLDGDGDIDVAGAPVAGPVFWHANLDGLGTFGAQQSTGLSSFSQIEPCDLDGDGDLDLLAAGGPAVRFLVNDGAGTFTLSPALFTSPPLVTAVASGDLDADGDLDIVARGTSNKILASLNLGGGVFAPASESTCDLTGVGSVELHDLDGDGAADALLASAAPGNGVQWLRNDGAGDLGGAIDVLMEPGSQSRATAVDLDLDGRLDVVWSDADSGTVAWSRNELCSTIAPAVESIRLGTPPNPDALAPGATSGPVVGATWDPVISHSSFLPSAVLDFVAIGVAPANAPTGLGTLLVDVGQPYAVASSPAAGAPFAIPVPADCGLVGTPLFAQGASTNGVFVLLTNALDLVLGSY